MKRREFITLVCCAAPAWPLAAFPQASTRRPLIVVLLGGSSTSAIFLASLIQGMEELGCVEGRDFDVAARHAEGDVTRMPALAADRRHFIEPLAWQQET